MAIQWCEAGKEIGGFTARISKRALYLNVSFFQELQAANIQRVKVGYDKDTDTLFLMPDDKGRKISQHTVAGSGLIGAGPIMAKWFEEQDLIGKCFHMEWDFESSSFCSKK